jgi:hypothetical protein
LEQFEVDARETIGIAKRDGLLELLDHLNAVYLE